MYTFRPSPIPMLSYEKQKLTASMPCDLATKTLEYRKLLRNLMLEIYLPTSL